MSEEAQNALLSVQYDLIFFGAIGMIAIGLIPYRAWEILRSRVSGYRRPVILSRLIVIMPTLVFDLQVTIKLYHCLMGQYCGPSVGSGWIYLGMLGAAYLIFEALNYLIKRCFDHATGMKRDVES